MGHQLAATAAQYRLPRETAMLYDCPECGLPAYVLDRFVRPSTDGPLPHAITVCARMHRLCTTEEPVGQIDAGSST